MIGQPELGSLGSLSAERRALAQLDSRSTLPTASWRNADESHANPSAGNPELRRACDFPLESARGGNADCPPSLREPCRGVEEHSAGAHVAPQFTLVVFW